MHVCFGSLPVAICAVVISIRLWLDIQGWRGIEHTPMKEIELKEEIEF